MTTKNLLGAYNIVTNHFEQTSLVNRLFDDWIISHSFIEYHITGLTEEEEESGEWENSIDIYEWLVFPELIESDYEKLIQAWIPVLKTDYGNWVATTSYGCHYDMFIHPELIKALFDIETDYFEIAEMKKKSPCLIS